MNTLNTSSDRADYYISGSRGNWVIFYGKRRVDFENMKTTFTSEEAAKKRVREIQRGYFVRFDILQRVNFLRICE